MLKENLYIILNNLRTIENKFNDKNTLYSKFVQDKLDASTNSYYKQMQELYNSLLKKDNIKLVKAFSKYFEEE